MQQYSIRVSGNAPLHYPVDTFFALLWYDTDDAIEVPKRYPYKGEWGQVLSHHLLEREEYPMPRVLDMVWLSIVERKFYSLRCSLPTEEMEALWLKTEDQSNQPLFSHIVVGMAPHGGVAVWIHGERKVVLKGWYHAEMTHVEMKDFMPMNPTVTLDENCDFYINNDLAVKENLEENGLPSPLLFEKYMQQFRYRYVVEFGRWNRREEEWRDCKEGDEIPVFDYIEESLFDGTHDKLRDGGLMEYHDAGKPKRLAVAWHIGKSDYKAYFWMDEHLIRSAFEQVFGTQTDCPTDFHVHIDPKKNEYQLSLHQQNMEDPYMLPKEAYELIVFKSKFEHYRSKNYNQNPGAWIW